MATKTITITKEAYETLASHKNKGESFSELILRTHTKKGNWEAISKFVGAWEHIPHKVIEDMKRDIEKMDKYSMKEAAKKVRGI